MTWDYTYCADARFCNEEQSITATYNEHICYILSPEYFGYNITVLYPIRCRMMTCDHRNGAYMCVF